MCVNYNAHLRYPYETFHSCLALIACNYGLTIDLGLPYGICNSPQNRQDEEYVGLVRIRMPQEQHNDHNNVQEGSKEENRHSSSLLDYKT